MAAKTPSGLAVERPILEVFFNDIKSAIITNQCIEWFRHFTKQLILKKDGSLSLIEILSLSLENLKVGVMS